MQGVLASIYHPCKLFDYICCNKQIASIVPQCPLSDHLLSAIQKLNIQVLDELDFCHRSVKKCWQTRVTFIPFSFSVNYQWIWMVKNFLKCVKFWMFNFVPWICSGCAKVLDCTCTYLNFSNFFHMKLSFHNIYFDFLWRPNPIWWMCEGYSLDNAIRSKMRKISKLVACHENSFLANDSQLVFF